MGSLQEAPKPFEFVNLQLAVATRINDADGARNVVLGDGLGQHPPKLLHRDAPAAVLVEHPEGLEVAHRDVHLGLVGLHTSSGLRRVRITLRVHHSMLALLPLLERLGQAPRVADHVGIGGERLVAGAARAVRRDGDARELIESALLTLTKLDLLGPHPFLKMGQLELQSAQLEPRALQPLVQGAARVRRRVQRRAQARPILVRTEVGARVGGCERQLRERQLRALQRGRGARDA